MSTAGLDRASRLLDVAGLQVSLLDPGSGSRRNIVDGVTLNVTPGAAWGLTGQSGGGKSTAVRALTGLLPKSAWVRAEHWTLFGQSVVTNSQWHRAEAVNRHIQRLSSGQLFLISQDARSTLVPFRTIGWHLAAASRTGGGNGSPRLFQETLERVGISSEAEAMLKRYPHQVAGGQCQRIQLAIALLLRKLRLLIADEPLASVDDATAQSCLQTMVDSLGPGGGMLHVSHHLDVLRRATQHVSVICNGHVAETGPTAIVLDEARARHPHTRLLLRLAHGETCPRMDRTAPSARDVACCFANACDRSDATLCRQSVPEEQSAATGQRFRCVRDEAAISVSTNPAAPVAAPRQPPELLLHAEGVSKSFRQRGLFHSHSTIGLQDRNLALRDGERVGLLGASGCGKTTMARILMGLETADAGRVGRFERPELSDTLDGRRQRELWRRMQWVPQDADVAFDPMARVGESLCQACRVADPGDTHAGHWARSAALLAQFRLDPSLLRATVAQLSGGERRRVAIARTLAGFGFLGPASARHEPRILILDEPSVGVDVFLQAFLADVLLAAQESLRLTYLVISHDRGFVGRLCPRHEEWTLEREASV